MPNSKTRIAVLPGDRARMVKVSIAALLAILVLFGLFLSLALGWMFSPERYVPNTSKEVELISSGETTGSLDSNGYLLAETKEGAPVVVDNFDPDNKPAKDKSFKAWYASKDDARFPMGEAWTYSSAGDGYYSFERLEPQLNDNNDGMWMVAISAVSAIFCALLYIPIMLICLSVKIKESLALSGSTFKGMFSETDSYLKKRDLKLPYLILGAMMTLHEIAFLLTLIFWTSAPGPNSYDWVLVLTAFVGHIVIAGIVFLFAGFLAESLAFYLFTRFIIRDPGRFPASMVRPAAEEDFEEDTEFVPPWIYKWLDKNGWHQETANVLLEDFEGTLGELSVISGELGPDKNS